MPEEEFSEKFKKLPQHIQEIMSSPETAEINGIIGKKYKLSDEQIGSMVNIVVHIIFKDVPLEGLVVNLRQKLNLDPQVAKKMALDILEKRFLPIKNRLPNIEQFMQNLGAKFVDPNIVNLKNQ